MKSTNPTPKKRPLEEPLNLDRNDRLWLESIIRNAAPGSDWWTKAHIVQLADSQSRVLDPKRVDGKSIDTQEEVAKRLVKEIHEICKKTGNYSQYFQDKVNRDYVIETIDYWCNRQFNQAIARNFEVYVNKENTNVFLVVSTAPSSLNVDRELPPKDFFRPLFNIDEMAQMVLLQKCNRITLRTHGYASPPSRFYRAFIQESNSLNLADETYQIGPLAKTHFYVGYYWPSEQPFLSPSLWVDYQDYGGIIIKFLTVLGSLSVVAGTLLYLFLKILGIPILIGLSSFPGISQILQSANLQSVTGIAVQWHWIVLTVLLLWLLLFQILRVVVYQRDRYRAIHYGAPDLAEFFWRLDRRIEIELNAGEATKSLIKYCQSGAKFQSSDRPTIAVNIIGHSLGSLVVTNVLRILSDRFGKDDLITECKADLKDLCQKKKQEIGDHLILDKLILCAPDIPLEFLREGRNNYVRSAILRCRSIYLMSSDRDVILRYLSTLANWFTEPCLEMSGLRLGNVYLQEVDEGNTTSKKYEPYVRIMLFSQPAAKQTSAYELFEKFNYIDCSNMKGLNGIKLSLYPSTALLIDIANLILSAFGKIDTHGGYFGADIPSFKILKFLLADNTPCSQEPNAQLLNHSCLKPLRDQKEILFLPSQPFLQERDNANSK